MVGGDLVARFANRAHLEAGRNVTIARELTQSRLIYRGICDLSGAMVVGGHITALGGVRRGVLGSSAGIPTIVQAGIDESLRRFGAEHGSALAGRIAELERLKTAVAPLIRNQKGLTAAEKERATELLYESGELEEQIGKMLQEIERR